MAQYPVITEEGLYEAVNYLASGPAGLGQNFSGFSAYTPAYLTGTFRQPYTVATTATNNPPSWYVDPIAISNVTGLNLVGGQTQYFQWTFTTPQGQPPFRVGQSIIGQGFSPGFYNNDAGIVLTCSTTTVVSVFKNLYTLPAVSTYGSLYFDNSEVLSSTDANARVTVQGPTDIVFISSQLALLSGYSCTTTSTFDISVQINRYEGFIDTSGQGAIDFLFNLDATVSEQTTSFTVNAGTGTSFIQNIFTTVLDQPSFGYYWYICELEFITKPTYRYTDFGGIVTGLLYDDGWTVSGTSTNITATFTNAVINVSSSGVGGQLKVEMDDITDYADATITVVNGGSGYAVGDTLKILGTDLGGATPANDLKITLTQITYPGDAVPKVQTLGLRSLTAQVIKQ